MTWRTRKPAARAIAARLAFMGGAGETRGGEKEGADVSYFE